MERTARAAVLPVDLGWSDIGSWSTVWDVLTHDDAGNATNGPVVMLDSRNSLVRSDESVLTTVVGVDDLIVVTTGDALLVASRAKAEQVKILVEELKAQNQRAAVEHRRMCRKLDRIPAQKRHVTLSAATTVFSIATSCAMLIRASAIGEGGAHG
jgi:mannose-1-phosphate guanylyltransferase/mannose-6-phosphate isomerase